MSNIENLPGLEVDVESALEATKKKRQFFDLAAGQTVTLRFLPHFSKTLWKETNKIGSVFFVKSQHFRMKNGGDTNVYACPNQHADYRCPVCDYVQAKLATMPNSTKADKKTRKDFLFAMGASKYFIAQALVVVAKGAKIDGISIVRFTDAMATKVAKIQEEERDILGTPPLAHPIEGQFVTYSKNAEQPVRYNVQPTGVRADLSALYPTWYAEMKDLGPDVLGLKVIPQEEMAESLMETIGAAEFARFLHVDGTLKD